MANEKDAMALAVLERAAAVAYTRCECPDSIACTECNLAAPYRKARAHLASRIADQAEEIRALKAEVKGLTQSLTDAIDQHEDAKVDAKFIREAYFKAEAELAAVRAWLAKLESFVGPGALAYIRREFDAARGGE